MKVGVGGTFNVLHRGHRVLLDKAFERGDFVVVGITSDEMARKDRGLVAPVGERKTKLERYLHTKGDNWSVTIIDTPSGRTDEMTDIRALIVSPETRESAAAINRTRASRCLEPLELIEVPHVLAADFQPISARRIAAGEIDEEGRLLRPLRVRVGSENHIKIDAVRNVLTKFYDEVEIAGVAVSTGVPEQPRAEMTRKGAMERARLALGDADIGVGLEAGVFETEDGLYDIQYCAVIDRRGRFTVGHGSGFKYPPEIAARVRAGDAVGKAFRESYGWETEGKVIGAIGFLTDGALTRTQLAEQAVMAAMVPRIKRELYPDL
jgi:inosine/xanthosine triphosphatase